MDIYDCVIINAFEVFDYITNGYSFMEPFIDFLTNEAQINQAKVKLVAKKIEALFGTLDDSHPKVAT